MEPLQTSGRDSAGLVCPCSGFFHIRLIILCICNNWESLDILKHEVFLNTELSKGLSSICGVWSTLLFGMWMVWMKKSDGYMQGYRGQDRVSNNKFLAPSLGCGSYLSAAWLVQSGLAFSPPCMAYILLVGFGMSHSILDWDDVFFVSEPFNNL